MELRGYSTTAVERDESGQSVLEFVLLLPLLLGFAVLMLRMNQAIQVSIVNQKYARAQALFLTMNHHEYPALDQRVANLTARGYNQMIIGVSDNPATDAGQTYVPEATEARVSRKKDAGSNEDQEEPDLRGRVRIRTTVALCTQPNVLSSGGQAVPILPMRNIGPTNAPVYRANGPYAYPIGNFKFDYCRTPLGTAEAGT